MNKFGVITLSLSLAFISFLNLESFSGMTLKVVENVNSTLPVIPQGSGFGMFTFAGSGPGRVGSDILHVTTLADSGPGSLRDAVEENNPRIIVFDVSGYIELERPLTISEPYVTIAGQTAPSTGITLKGAGLEIKTHDVLVQHIRVRVGDDPEGPDPLTRSGIAITDYRDNDNNVYNVVVDHVSVSWAVDENFITYYKGIRDITVSNSIISESLWHSIHPWGAQSHGFLVGHGTQSLSVIGNLFAHNDQRNMFVSGNTGSVFANNLIYNWYGANPNGGASVYGNARGKLFASIVGNVYIRGPNTRPGSASIPVNIWSIITKGSRVYLNDNEALEKNNDLWSVAKIELTKVNDSQSLSQEEVDNLNKWLHPPTEREVLDEVRADTPPIWIPSFKARKSKEVKEWVLGNAGARPADRDEVDRRIVREVRNGTGRIIDSPNDVGGWQPLAEKVRGVGGVPSLAIPSHEIQPSGYTAVEEWLHEMARKVER